LDIEAGRRRAHGNVLNPLGALGVLALRHRLERKLRKGDRPVARNLRPPLLGVRAGDGDAVDLGVDPLKEGLHRAANVRIIHTGLRVEDNHAGRSGAPFESTSVEYVDSLLGLRPGKLELVAELSTDGPTQCDQPGSEEEPPEQHETPAPVACSGNSFEHGSSVRTRSKTLLDVSPWFQSEAAEVVGPCSYFVGTRVTHKEESEHTHDVCGRREVHAVRTSKSSVGRRSGVALR
jgi:hypothetical protein